MKKIHILLAAFLATAGLASCDMEKYPYNSVEESQYMTQLGDFQAARYGIYSNYRGLTTGGYILNTEMQADNFYATVDYGNYFGYFYRWDIQTGNGDIESMWSGYYSTIARCNYYIDGYQRVVDGTVTGFTEENMTEIGSYAAEAYFTRAFCYYNLAVLFCHPYDASTASSEMGLPLQLTYSPSSDASTYPGRSSLADTYAQINSDLSEASRLLQGLYALNSNATNALYYITPDAITALQARVALQMKDYNTAISASTALINSGEYALVSDAATYRGIWEEDNGAETIWQIYMSNPNELGNPTGLYFHGQYGTTPQRPSYYPSQTVIDMYDQENDIRFAAFFMPFTYEASTGASGAIYKFDKYPGNPTMGLSTDDHYINMSKPFRIAEQYLIAAEAYLESGNTTEATNYLNTLCSNRIAGYAGLSSSSTESLRSAIREERNKELIGEGFRLADLKRWGLGVDRGNNAQNNDLTFGVGLSNGTSLTVSADDYRFTWPIPQAEMDVNPQLRGQQNPGY